MSKLKNKAKKTFSIPERKEIIGWLQTCDAPRTLKQITTDLNLTDAKKNAVENRLKAMVRDGQLLRDRQDRYGLTKSKGLIRGQVIGHTDGYGFLVPDDGGKDLYLSARQMCTLLHGDRALVRVLHVDRKDRLAGELVEVLERANQYIIGKIAKIDNIFYVIPDNKHIHQNILIKAPHLHGAKNGQFVVAEIIQQPKKNLQPLGKITEIIGDELTPKITVDLTIRNHHLPYQWPKSVIAESAKLTDKITPDMLNNRTDLRRLPLVTIDGEDAQDFDDAVYCGRHDENWRLLVAIADVSHYIPVDSELDIEAKNRGTSVYFPNQVIPMLPEKLSNDLCSLKPDCDRLSLVCELIIDQQGNVLKTVFFRAIIRSNARLTYTEVASILTEENAKFTDKYHRLLPHLTDLKQVYECLNKKRKQNGLVEYSTTESQFKYDKAGKIIHIYPQQRNIAHRLIEEFMLAANVAAANYLTEKNIPILYRVHAKPKKEKLENVRVFLAELGLRLTGSDKPNITDYAKVIKQIETRTDRHIIETILLRSMPLAVYQNNNIGHFGLGFPSYAHFTSPIRRYPDLLVHRAIQHTLKKHSNTPYTYNKQMLTSLGEHCSSLERRAEEANFDALRRLKCQFIYDKIGQSFFGSISNVTAFGLFIELDNIYIDGLLHISALPTDYYHFDPIRHHLRGERTGKLFRLGDKLHISVARVDLDEKKIDFNLV